jgi:hypothetical protein
MRSKRIRRSIAGAVVGLGISAAVALAVWTVSGSGAGQGAATVAQGLTITATLPTGANASLYPGGPAGPVQFTVNNPNPFAVVLSGLGWGAPISLNATACASSNISVDSNAPSTTSIVIPANSSSALTTVPGVLDLSHAAPNGCQGVGFQVPVTVTGTQQ